jgi:hypothetical protein
MKFVFLSALAALVLANSQTGCVGSVDVTISVDETKGKHPAANHHIRKDPNGA